MSHNGRPTAEELIAWMETPGRAEAFGAQMLAEFEEADRQRAEIDARCLIAEAKRGAGFPPRLVDYYPSADLLFKKVKP